MNEQLINELCEKFHTTVNNLIPVYAKYAMTKDIASGLICLLFIAISVAILIYLRHKAKKNQYYDYLYDASATEMVLMASATAIAVFLFIAICIAICINIYDYIMWLHFPSMRFLDHITNMSN